MSTQDHGRCAEHPGRIHERTRDCRRFMTLAFAIDLGLESPERLGCEDDDGRPVMPDCANPNGGCPCEPSHGFTERAWRPEDDDHALAQVLRRMLTDDDGDWANVSVDVHSGSSMLSIETPYLELAADEAAAVRRVMV